MAMRRRKEAESWSWAEDEVVTPIKPGRQYHTIPVPRHMTVEDAWAELLIMGRFVEYSRWSRKFRRCRWAVVEYDPEDNS